jgi:hypothetical protein
MSSNLLLLLVFFTLLSVPPVGAETVYCIDAQGQRHIADDMMSLPESCRLEFKKLAPDDSGRVNYVPPVSPATDSGADFKRAVRAQDAELEKKKRYTESLLRRAERISRTYQEAVEARKEAQRSKSYGRREILRRADDQMQQSRNDKEVLLNELGQARIYGQERQEIEELLNKVE